jgi:hypothetical protein
MARQKKKAGDASVGVIMARVRPIALGVLIAGVIIGGCGFGFVQLRRHVERDLSYPPTAPAIVLKDRPLWMTEKLAEQIALSVRPRRAYSAMDAHLLDEIVETLQKNPWVREVRQVRRAFANAPGDAIEIHCDYRAPMAMVAWKSQYVLVDGEGYRLPEKISADKVQRTLLSDDGKVNIRIIEGISAMPPYLDGQKWSGEDIQAGLDLCKLLYGQPYAEEIHRVNVANYRGRKNAREAQLVLITKYQSEIRWGAPIKSATNFELPPAQKLERLAAVQQKYGRVDGEHSWLDIRFDKITYPAAENPLVQASTTERAGHGTN